MSDDPTATTEDNVNKRPNIADEFVDAILERIRAEIAHRTLKIVYGQVEGLTDTGLSVVIEGNKFEVQWTATSMTFAPGDIVMLMIGPSVPLTVLCKRIRSNEAAATGDATWASIL